MSNAGFVAAGLYGLARIFRDGLFDNSPDRVPYIVFFAGAALVGLGSGYYHWAPSNERLFWDRLPMTIAFMSFFAAVIADRIHRRVGLVWLLPILLFAGAFSLIYWQRTEAAGAGDLRFYGMVQFFPLAAIPVIFWLFRDYRYTEGKPLLLAIGWYVGSKIMEHFDLLLLGLSGGTVSGHSLKHMAAAVAVFWVLRMLNDAQNS
ncbi:MAG: ceramidase domain-containing protein [Nitrospinota bacterium]